MQQFQLAPSRSQANLDAAGGLPTPPNSGEALATTPGPSKHALAPLPREPVSPSPTRTRTVGLSPARTPTARGSRAASRGGSRSPTKKTLRAGDEDGSDEENLRTPMKLKMVKEVDESADEEEEEEEEIKLISFKRGGAEASFIREIKENGWDQPLPPSPIKFTYLQPDPPRPRRQSSVGSRRSKTPSVRASPAPSRRSAAGGDVSDESIKTSGSTRTSTSRRSGRVSVARSSAPPPVVVADLTRDHPSLPDSPGDDPLLLTGPDTYLVYHEGTPSARQRRGSKAQNHSTPLPTTGERQRRGSAGSSSSLYARMSGREAPQEEEGAPFIAFDDEDGFESDSDADEPVGAQGEQEQEAVTDVSRSFADEEDSAAAVLNNFDEENNDQSMGVDAMDQSADVSASDESEDLDAADHSLATSGLEESEDLSTNHTSLDASAVDQSMATDHDASEDVEANDPSIADQSMGTAGEDASEDLSKDLSAENQTADASIAVSNADQSMDTGNEDASEDLSEDVSAGDQIADVSVADQSMQTEGEDASEDVSAEDQTAHVSIANQSTVSGNQDASEDLSASDDNEDLGTEDRAADVSVVDQSLDASVHDQTADASARNDNNELGISDNHEDISDQNQSTSLNPADHSLAASAADESMVDDDVDRSMVDQSVNSVDISAANDQSILSGPVDHSMDASAYDVEVVDQSEEASDAPDVSFAPDHNVAANQSVDQQDASAESALNASNADSSAIADTTAASAVVAEASFDNSHLNADDSHAHPSVHDLSEHHDRLVDCSTSIVDHRQIEESQTEPSACDLSTTHTEHNDSLADASASILAERSHILTDASIAISSDNTYAFNANHSAPAPNHVVEVVLPVSSVGLSDYRRATRTAASEAVDISFSLRHEDPVDLSEDAGDISMPLARRVEGLPRSESLSSVLSAVSSIGASEDEEEALREKLHSSRDSAPERSLARRTSLSTDSERESEAELEEVEDLEEDVEEGQEGEDGDLREDFRPSFVDEEAEESEVSGEEEEGEDAEGMSSSSNSAIEDDVELDEESEESDDEEDASSLLDEEQSASPEPVVVLSSSASPSASEADSSYIIKVVPDSRRHSSSHSILTEDEPQIHTLHVRQPDHSFHTADASHSRSRVLKLGQATSTPIVEISSLDPRAAARATAILKMFHKYVDEGFAEGEETGMGVRRMVDAIRREREEMEEGEEGGEELTRILMDAELALAREGTVESRASPATPFLPGGFRATPAAAARGRESLTFPSLTTPSRPSRRQSEARQARLSTALQPPSPTTFSPRTWDTTDWTRLDKYFTSGLKKLSSPPSGSSRTDKARSYVDAMFSIDLSEVAQLFLHEMGIPPEARFGEWGEKKVEYRLEALVRKYLRKVEAKYPEALQGRNLGDLDRSGAEESMPSVGEEWSLTNNTTQQGSGKGRGRVSFGTPYRMGAHSTPAGGLLRKATAQAARVQQREERVYPPLPTPATERQEEGVVAKASKLISRLSGGFSGLLSSPRGVAEEKGKRKATEAEIEPPSTRRRVEEEEEGDSSADSMVESMLSSRGGLTTINGSLFTNATSISSSRTAPAAKAASLLAPTTRAPVPSATISRSFSRTAPARAATVLAPSAASRLPVPCSRTGLTSSLQLAGGSSGVSHTPLSLLSPGTHRQAARKVDELRQSRVARRWVSPQRQKARATKAAVGSVRAEGRPEARRVSDTGNSSGGSGSGRDGSEGSRSPSLADIITSKGAGEAVSKRRR